MPRSRGLDILQALHRNSILVSFCKRGVPDGATSVCQSVEMWVLWFDTMCAIQKKDHHLPKVGGLAQCCPKGSISF